MTNIFQCEQRIIEQLLRFSNHIKGNSAESIYRESVERFRQLVQAKACLLYMLDSERQRLGVREACGIEAPAGTLPELGLEDSKVGQVISTGRATLVSKLTENKEISVKARKIAISEMHQEAAIIPMEIHGGRGAVALFYTKLPNAFSVERLELLAKSLAVTLEYRSNRAAPERLDWILQHAAHSLRSPLEGIAGKIDELREQLNKGTRRQHSKIEISRVAEIWLHGQDARLCKQLLTDVELEVERGERRIATVLSSRPGNLSIAESDMTMVRLGDVVERCANRQRLPAKKRGITILVRDSVKRMPAIVADESLLDIAFDNLIENARKYGDDNTVVEITARQIGGQIRIRITDRGLRIPLALESSLFEAYTRPVQSAFRSIKGTGLGLQITNSIIKGHGGSIETESEPDPQESRARKLYNEGYFTTFEVVLPAMTRRRAGR